MKFQLSFDEIYGGDISHELVSEMYMVSLHRFKKKLGGIGMLIKKKSSRGYSFNSCRLSYSGDYLHISSFTNKKSINMKKVKICKTIGRHLIFSTEEYGIIVLKIPSVSDALVFKNVLDGNGENFVLKKSYSNRMK